MFDIVYILTPERVLKTIEILMLKLYFLLGFIRSAGTEDN